VCERSRIGRPGRRSAKSYQSGTAAESQLHFRSNRGYMKRPNNSLNTLFADVRQRRCRRDPPRADRCDAKTSLTSRLSKGDSENQR